MLFAMALCDKMLLQVLGGVLGKVGVWGTYAIALILLAAALPNILRVVHKWDVVAFLGWASLLLINVLFLRREQQEYTSCMIEVFVKCFPLYFLGRAAADDEDANILKCMQWIVVLIGLGYVLSLLRNGLDYGNKSYSQYMGYTLLPAAGIALCLSLKGKLLQIPFAALLLYGVVASGARGPLLCLLLVGAVYIVGRMNNFSTKRVILLIVVGMIVAVVWVNFETILDSMIRFFERNGFSVRVLNSLAQGTFAEDSARNELYELSLQGAWDHPFGIGIFRDRQYLQLGWIGMVNDSSSGYYSHNLFLEFLLQYGIVIGMLLSIVFSVFTWKAFRNSRKSETRLVCLTVLLGVGLFPLMVSESYLEWEPFYLLVGYMVTTTQKGRSAKRLEGTNGTPSC